MAKEFLKRLLFVNIFLITILSCTTRFENRVIIYKIHNEYWAYKIELKGKIIIRQEHIPAVNKNNYFNSQKDAEQVGNLVLKKLLERPDEFPDISLKELDSLKIKR